MMILLCIIACQYVILNLVLNKIIIILYYIIEHYDNTQTLCVYNIIRYKPAAVSVVYPLWGTFADVSPLFFTPVKYGYWSRASVDIKFFYGMKKY